MKKPPNDINPPKKVTRTRKRKVEVLVPALAEYIIQPNHVTNARYEYTLLQERIFTGMMHYLQADIKDLIHNATPQQLRIFSENEKSENIITLPIHLKDIALPEHYNQVVAAAKRMRNTSIVFKIKDKEGNESTVVDGLISRAVIPAAGHRRSSILEIDIHRQVAEILIDVQKKGNVPVEYTRYVYQIAQQASSKYTSLLYKKICSWRAKGGFTISLENLHKDICVRKVYLKKDGTVNYKNFKEKVLEKARTELYQKADCWFEYAELYEGRSVKNLRFKIITPETEEMNERRKETVKQGLRMRLHLSEQQISALSPLFNEENFNFDIVIAKIDSLVEYMRKNRWEIKNSKAYAFNSLKNMISAFTKG